MPKKKNRSVFRIVEKYLKNIITNHEISTSFSKMKSSITNSISGMFYDNGQPYKDMLSEALDKYV